MEASDFKAFLRTQIESARDDYVKDLSSMTHEQLAGSPGGSARTGYDITHEVVAVNERIAKRLRREDPGPWPFEGWVTAPQERQTKDAASNAISTSLAEVIEAFDAIDASDLKSEIPTATGTTTALDLAYMAAYHTGYHDAQLNYLQSIHGDTEVHW